MRRTLIAAPASGAPGVRGFPVRQYAPRAQYVTVHAYNPTDRRVLVAIGADVPWLHPAIDAVWLRPGEQSRIAVRIIRPVDVGAVGHLTLTVRKGYAAGGVGLAIVNDMAPVADRSMLLPIALGGIAATLRRMARRGPRAGAAR